ncbi:MAG TPA: TMEM175 family protein [Chitinophagaceae bacterium]|nr:TMEM175 family protein [Chitinophagaceae bacterium]
MTKTRLEAFSDGVLAIIITIMVLELRPPQGTSWAAIQPLLPSLTSYMLSFALVAIYWGNHHHLLHAATHINSRIIWANMHLLFWLSLVPFATSWVGGNNFDRISVAVYAAVQAVCAVAYYILLRVIVASQPHNTHLAVPLKKQSRKGFLSLVTYLIAIPAAFLHPAISEVLFVLIAIVWWIPDRNIERALRE